MLFKQDEIIRLQFLYKEAAESEWCSGGLQNMNSVAGFIGLVLVTASGGWQKLLMECGLMTWTADASWSSKKGGSVPPVMNYSNPGEYDDMEKIQEVSRMLRLCEKQKVPPGEML